MSPCRNPLHCIVQPSVFQRIAERGTPRQRARALRAIRLDELIRSARLQNQALRGNLPRGGFDALAELARQAAGPSADRSIVDARGRATVLGPVVRREGQGETGDRAVDDAYDGLGDTFELYLRVYSRNSIDGVGLPLRGVVHYSRDYANAFWDGRQMVFGDGDGEIFSPLTGALDVIGHELTHGVTEDEARLIYLGQAGALNESISDVFASLVKQYKRNERADQANWLIGEDVWTPEINGDALRSLRAPGTAYDDPLVGTDDQPAHMDDYVVTVTDNGGVHTNSGIPNRAFYLVATEIGGHAWEQAGRIWYDALRDPRVTPRTNFAGFAWVTSSVAQRLYGRTSREADAVRSGWDGVGIAVP